MNSASPLQRKLERLEHRMLHETLTAREFNAAQVEAARLRQMLGW